MKRGSTSCPQQVIWSKLRTRLLHVHRKVLSLLPLRHIHITGGIRGPAHTPPPPHVARCSELFSSPGVSHSSLGRGFPEGSERHLLFQLVPLLSASTPPPRRDSHQDGMVLFFHSVVFTLSPPLEAGFCPSLERTVVRRRRPVLLPHPWCPPLLGTAGCSSILS